jgi:dTDP-3-amino-3,4,6-trideoxy-alpha-D-glucose transaminase
VNASTPHRIPFLDLHPAEDAREVREAIERVVTRGWFVLGPEVEAFEAEFAAASDARFAAGVGNGTDAIALALRALGIAGTDEVIVPAMTAAYTALAVLAAGATPVIVDVEAETLTMDPAACLAAVSPRTRAIVPVHLYGQAARMSELLAVAGRHSLAVVEDCCQAHLATYGGVHVGTRSTAGAFSFYPTKNLGALGDGGAVITNDESLAARVKRLRNGGQTERYHHQEAGVNSRLDEIQAAVLRARLPYLARWTTRRREIAALYRRLLPATLQTIHQRDEGHVYHLFPVRSAARGALQAHLAHNGVETLIHYPIPLHEQPALAPYAPSPCQEAARAGRELLSLPNHPQLTDADATRVAGAVGAFDRGRVPA